jgi:hypothetical protein
MPPKTLLQAGIVSLLAGIVLFLSIPIGLTYVEMYPVSYWTVAAVLFWFCISLTGAGGLLVFRAAFGTTAGDMESQPPHISSNAPEKC